MTIFGDRVAEARRRKDWSQRQLADALGYKSEDAIGAWETRGVLPREAVRRAVAAALDVTYEQLMGEAEVAYPIKPGALIPVRAGQSGKRLPPKAYEVIYGYTQQLEAAGFTTEEIDEAERFLFDGAYNKINAREPGEKNEADLILDIKAAWQFVRDVASRHGRKL